jgi:hypothetical protein
MPRHNDPDSAVSPKLRKAALEMDAVMEGVLDESLDAEGFERQLKALVDCFARARMRRYLARRGGNEAFEEEGQRWRVTLRNRKKIMTAFGWVEVERPLFRQTRDGPTRCLVSENADLVEGKWTPLAAKVASLATTELSFERSEQFFQELGGMAPCRTLLIGLDRYLSDLWEQDREQHEQQVREASEIPTEAVACAVSLDGVMINMVGSDRAEKKAQAKAAGKAAKGPSGYKEASVGVLSFYDADGDRLATWRTGRMPEPDKTTTKAWVEAELDHVRERRPDLTVVAAADGAANNWGFLESLGPDEQVVDYYHTAEHLHRRLSIANGASTLDTQQKFREMKGTLLEQKGGAKIVFAELQRLQKSAGTLPKSATKKSGKRQPTYFERHHERMNYAELRKRNLPIGTGVTEGTCRHLVVDRLRRSGMAWSEAGGQAVMTLRSLAVSDRYDAAWAVLLGANRWRLRRVG